LDQSWCCTSKTPQISLHVCLPQEQAASAEQVVSRGWETRCMHIWCVHPGLGGQEIPGCTAACRWAPRESSPSGFEPGKRHRCCPATLSCSRTNSDRVLDPSHSSLASVQQNHFSAQGLVQMPRQLCTALVSHFIPLGRFSRGVCLHEKPEGQQGGKGQHVKI